MTENKAAPASGSILVVGGGISGLTTALEAAEVGYEVFLVEKNPYLGGRVAQLNQYFPKLCPPTCGLEINFRRIKDNPLIKVLTLAEVEKVDGGPGDYDVRSRSTPATSTKTALLRRMRQGLPDRNRQRLQFRHGKTKGAYLPFEMAFPARYVISPRNHRHR
jgi:quinone-modifying oxidoreductase subunit QmoA